MWEGRLTLVPTASDTENRKYIQQESICFHTMEPTDVSSADFRQTGIPCTIAHYRITGL